MKRPDGRSDADLRPVTLQTGYLQWAEGSVLMDMGSTRVLAAAWIGGVVLVVAISLAAGVQVACSIPNFLCQEQVSLGEGYIKNPFKVRDGFLDVPKGPGLGIELDEQAMADKIGHDWRNQESYDPEDLARSGCDDSRRFAGSPRKRGRPGKCRPV